LLNIMHHDGNDVERFLLLALCSHFRYRCQELCPWLSQLP